MLEQELTGSGPADPLKVREFWVETVRGAADRGRLEKIPTRRARTKREESQAKTQNHWISRRSYAGAGDNYTRIDWSH